MSEQAWLRRDCYVPGLSGLKIDVAEAHEPRHAVRRRRVELNGLLSRHLAVIRHIEIGRNRVARASTNIRDRKVGVRETEAERKQRHKLLLLEPAITKVCALSV